MNDSGIYAITHCLFGRVYIGSSVGVDRRLKQHRRMLRKDRHDNQYLQNSWNKNGEDQFEFETIEFCRDNELIEREQFWIDLLGAHKTKNGFNITKTAGSTRGYRHSKDSREKMSRAIKKRFVEDEEFRELVQNNFRGHRHSEETKKKMSATRKGSLTDKQAAALAMGRKIRLKTPMREETKKKISESHKGKKLTAETKLKISEANKIRHKNRKAQ